MNALGLPGAERLQIPSTVTIGGVKSLKPNLGQSHLASKRVFGLWRWQFGFVLNA